MSPADATQPAEDQERHLVGPGAARTMIEVHGESWDRQPGERDSDYQRFILFRNLGPARTLNQLAGMCEVTIQNLRNASSINHWYDRAMAWDRFNDTLYGLRMADERKRIVTRHIDIADQLLDKVTERMAQLDPKKLGPRELGQWVDVAAKVQRSAIEIHEMQNTSRHPSIQINVADNRTQSVSIEQRVMERRDVFAQLAEAYQALDGPSTEEPVVEGEVATIDIPGEDTAAAA